VGWGWGQLGIEYGDKRGWGRIQKAIRTVNMWSVNLVPNFSPLASGRGLGFFVVSSCSLANWAATCGGGRVGHGCGGRQREGEATVDAREV